MTQWTWEGFEKRKRKTYWANVGAAASEPLSPPASNVSLWEETCAESPRRNKWAETPRGNKWGILAVWDGSEWSKNTNLYLSLSLRHPTLLKQHVFAETLAEACKCHSLLMKCHTSHIKQQLTSNRKISLCLTWGRLVVVTRVIIKITSRTGP